jgi:hypothetical protein
MYNIGKVDHANIYPTIYSKHIFNNHKKGRHTIIKIKEVSHILPCTKKKNLT